MAGGRGGGAQARVGVGWTRGWIGGGAKEGRAGGFARLWAGGRVGGWPQPATPQVQVSAVQLSMLNVGVSEQKRGEGRGVCFWACLPSCLLQSSGARASLAAAAAGVRTLLWARRESWASPGFQTKGHWLGRRTLGGWVYVFCVGGIGCNPAQPLLHAAVPAWRACRGPAPDRAACNSEFRSTAHSPSPPCAHTHASKPRARARAGQPQHRQRASRRRCAVGRHGHAQRWRQGPSLASAALRGGRYQG